MTKTEIDEFIRNVDTKKLTYTVQPRRISILNDLATRCDTVGFIKELLKLYGDLYKKAGYTMPSCMYLSGISYLDKGYEKWLKYPDGTLLELNKERVDFMALHYGGYFLVETDLYRLYYKKSSFNNTCGTILELATKLEDIKKIN